MNHATHRIFAIDPIAQGFGYVVLEGDARLIDWGTVGTRAPKTADIMARVVRFVDAFQPDVIAIEDLRRHRGRPRSERAIRLLKAVRELARQRRIVVAEVPWQQVRVAFDPAGRASRYQIAVMTVQRFPVLGSTLPPPKKFWQRESSQMSVFDAAALGLVATETHQSLGGRDSCCAAHRETIAGVEGV